MIKFQKHKGFKIIIAILIGLAVLLFAVTVGGYFWVKNLSPEKMLGLLQSDIVKQQVRPDDRGIFDVVPRLLGFTNPITYLVLFENNTELRPGGGFIGSYAVVQIDKGKMNILAIDGTENLDRSAPTDWLPVAPAPITNNLKTSRWYFRDSNWSPDFAVDAQKAVELYKGEKGVGAENINVVVAITPTVIEEILMLVGPITIQGTEFKAENVTEKLEYEVEYAFDKKGVDFKDRKQVLKPFMLELISRLEKNVFFNFNNYLNIFSSLSAQKQIMFYSFEPQIQKLVSQKGWNGEVASTTGDYLLWVDANLAALKTDYAIKRTLNYFLEKQTDGRLLAVASMNYVHTGKFDWRTTRYRTYARIFVPLGSELVSTTGAMKSDRTTAPGIIDQGQELEKQWFGTFIAIEPGQTKSLVFKYYLPLSIQQQIDNGLYTLFVQKQLGTIASGLTLNQNFGKNISTSTPSGEASSTIYQYQGDLRLDRKFSINF